MKIKKSSIANIVLVMIMLLSVTVFAASCGDDTTDTPTTEGTTIDDTATTEDTEELPEAVDTSAVEDEATAKTPLSIAQALADECNGTDVAESDAAIVGADLGASFMVGDNKFEVYQFSDEAKITEAQGGKMQFAHEGADAYEMLASVNGNFVMLYATADDAVITAFGNQ